MKNFIEIKLLQPQKNLYFYKLKWFSFTSGGFFVLIFHVCGSDGKEAFFYVDSFE